MEEIKIIKIITEEITEPRKDGTRGSSLYSIPFKLNATPSSLWIDAFIKTWNLPPSYTSMHRPGIASVSGDRIILDGTTIEEVKDTHKKTLELCISEANRIEQEILENKQKQKEQDKKKSDEFRRNLETKAKEIHFE